MFKKLFHVLLVVFKKKRCCRNVYLKRGDEGGSTHTNVNTGICSFSAAKNIIARTIDSRRNYFSRDI